MSKSLVEMAAEIIKSQITGSNMSTDEIKSALNDTYQALKGLQEAEQAGADIEEKEEKPVMDPKRSIQKHRIVCLECGQSFKMLTKHLKLHNMTSKEYRQKYGFSRTQSLCAKALSEERSQASKERGIHPNLRKTFGSRAKKAKK